MAHENERPPLAERLARSWVGERSAFSDRVPARKCCAPGGRRELGRVLSQIDGSATDLAGAIRLASAEFPDGKARLFPVSWVGPTDRPDAEFDLHLNNGRLLEHFHEGNLTYRSPGIKEKTPDTFVEVSPELAEARGIQTGSLVQLTSRRGRLRVRAVVTDRVQNGELYMPMNSSGTPVNILTGSHTDPETLRCSLRTTPTPGCRLTGYSRLEDG